MINARSIQFRLIAWYSCLSIAVLLAFAYYAYLGARRQLYSDMEHVFIRRSRQIAADTLSQELSPAAVARQIRSVYSPEANNRFIRITRTDGSVLYSSGLPENRRFNPAAIPLPAASAPRLRIESLPGVQMLLTATPVHADGSSYLIEMGASTGETEHTLHGLLITLLSGLPVVIFIVSAGGYMLVRRALLPVETIRSTAERITFGNLSNRLPVVQTGDALEHLSVTLNQMLDRLEDAYDQASRFSADASHELRTPLAILRGEMESLVRDPAARPLRDRLGSMLEETERLSRITESLFSISRLDAGEARIDHAPCDLAALAQNTAEQMALLAVEKNIALHIAAASPVPVTGDAARFKQVVVNLLDNAIKYASFGGNIWLGVFSEPPKAVLEVSDDGPGIPVEALPHVFERFYRADKARSRERGGAGLGLSIVRSICTAHGGTVEIHNREAGGALCRVELPLSGSGRGES